ncbi:MAG: septum formation initiator family protein [Clostridia bacterium]|nr:septum formation initiator family protein [Clostridia bacterium]
MRKLFNFQNIIFIALAVYLTVLLFNQQGTLSAKMEQNQELKQQIASAEAQLEALQEEEKLLDTDAYIEQKAREILGYVKSNEIVYIKH